MIRDGIRRALALALRRRDRWERDVEDEIKLHLTLRAEQLAAAGRSPQDAYDEAVRRFGPLQESRARLLEAARHREERMQRTEFFGNLRQDLSFAVRTLGRQKAWTAVTILTLALGIGATTAVFSVVSTLLIHPLPFPNADRIVHVFQQPSGGNNTGISVSIAPSAPTVRAWMKNARSFEAFEGSQLGPRPMKTTGDEPSSVMVEAVFPSHAGFAGVQPVLGRMFTPTDILNGGHVVVLSESFWRNRLSAKRDVLGQALTLGDSSYMIVGVMPAGMSEPTSGAPTDMWTPIDVRDDQQGMALMGRLRPGVSIATATTELDSIFARVSHATDRHLPFRTVVATPAQTVRFRDSLVLLSAAVALVLLVACANVAHLLLARAATRRREMAIRAALGAGRARLLRQLFTESLLLSLVGTVCGLVVGWAGLRGMIALRPRSLDSISLAHLDATTLAIAIGVAVVSGVAFALIGAVQSSRSSTHDALKSGSPSTAGLRRRVRGRGLLVISEMAVSAMLLVGAALLVRSMMRLQRTDLGFDAHGLYAISVPFSPSHIESEDARHQLIADFTSRVRRISGVRSVSVATISPGSRWFSIGTLEVEGEASPPRGTMSFIDVNAVDRSYFATMKMNVAQGRVFDDTTAAANEVIVNAGFARAHWPRGSALGRRIRIAQSDTVAWMHIVGVVGDARTGGPLSESSAPMLYTPATKTAGIPKVMVRVDGDARTLAPALDMLKQMGMKRVPPIESVTETLARSLAGPRFVLLLLTIFTMLALVLAAIGLYGVMAYTVTERTREIGIRVALGASGRRIARSVVAAGAWLAVAGAVLGLGLAAWGTRLIETQLHGITRLDPVSFAIGAAVLIAVALVACIVPTRRALSVDPMTAIRAD